MFSENLRYSPKKVTMSSSKNLRTNTASSKIFGRTTSNFHKEELQK